MIRTLYYTFTLDEDGIDFIDYEYPVEESLGDIQIYEYERAFGKEYDESSWYLDDGAREMADRLHDGWYVTNSLAPDDYYAFDFDFRDWLKARYREDALCRCLAEVCSDGEGPDEI